MMSEEEQGRRGAGLTARPSIKIRRHFDCPDLVIINRNPSAQDVATACTTAADPAPVPQPPEPPAPQRRLLPPPPSSSFTSPSSTFVSRLPRRRLTMPGIIKYDEPPPDFLRPGGSSRAATPVAEPIPAEYLTPAATITAAHDVPSVDAGLGVRGGRPATEMYLVENCARKRLQEEQIAEVRVTTDDEGRHQGLEVADAASILDTPSLDGLDPPKPLQMRYRQVHACCCSVNYLSPLLHL